tara:strand:+ start:241 stop:381 length:141 start_codon:yes stop_codon:yes gene_type:complete
MYKGQVSGTKISQEIKKLMGKVKSSKVVKGIRKNRKKRSKKSGIEI